MALTTTTVAELDTLTDEACARVLTLLRDVGPDARPRGAGWSSRDVAVHLLTVVERYTRRDFSQPTGLATDVRELPQLNDLALRSYEDLPFDDVLDRLASEHAMVPALPLEDVFPFHGGQRIDGAGARANLLGEFLLHGHDVARATGRPWTLPPRACALALGAMLQVAPGWLDLAAAEGADLRVVLEVSGQSGLRGQCVTIEGSRCTIRDSSPDDRPHAVVRGPADALLLQFYGRIGVLGAARRGVVVAGGSRPWRGLGLGRLFHPV